MDCIVYLLSGIGERIGVHRIFKQLMDEEESRVRTNRAIRSKVFLKIPWNITSITVIARDHWETLAAEA